MKELKKLILSMIQTAVITGITLFSVMPFSCKVTPEGVQIVGGDYALPVIESIEVLDESSVQISFSEKVKVSGAVLSPFFEGLSDSYAHSTTEELSPAIKAASGAYGKIPVKIQTMEDEKSVLFTFDAPTSIGKTYELYAVVEDFIGNTLTFTTSFTGYNSRVPQLIMTEVYFYNESGKDKTKFRTEYVEFLSLSDGNLANLRFYGASKGEEKGYDFPAIEVHKGEIILLHLRNKGEGCISEEGEDLNMAEGETAGKDVRDLWTSSTELCFSKTSDAIILKNKATGQILDGMCFAKTDSSAWNSKALPDIECLYEKGFIDSMEICDAASKGKSDSSANSLIRIDAEDIYEEMMTGELEYPVVSCADNWNLDKKTPGTL